MVSFSLLCLLFIRLVQAEDKIENNTIDRTVQIRTHSIYAPYIDQDLQNRWWDFGADSYVNTNKHIRLTRPAPSQMGWLWSRMPLTASNYVIEVEFKIFGESTHLFGDGLAMWLTTERIQPGPVFGNQDKFTGLGIFLDTYANSRHSYSFPRVNAMLGDGQTSYNFGNDGEDTTIGGCSANYRRTNVATKLKITYLKNSTLDVKIQYQAWDEWSDCFHIDKISLPSAPFLGFSAMTGDVFDSHDIITVTTYSLVPSQGAPHNKMTAGPHSSDSTGGSWFGFLFKLSLFAGVCAGGWHAWKWYALQHGYDDGSRAFARWGESGLSGLYTNGKRF